MATLFLRKDPALKVAIHPSLPQPQLSRILTIMEWVRICKQANRAIHFQEQTLTTTVVTQQIGISTTQPKVLRQDKLCWNKKISNRVISLSFNCSIHWSRREWKLHQSLNLVRLFIMHLITIIVRVFAHLNKKCELNLKTREATQLRLNSK